MPMDMRGPLSKDRRRMLEQYQAYQQAVDKQLGTTTYANAILPDTIKYAQTEQGNPDVLNTLSSNAMYTPAEGGQLHRDGTRSAIINNAAYANLFRQYGFFDNEDYVRKGYQEYASTPYLQKLIADVQGKLTASQQKDTEYAEKKKAYETKLENASRMAPEWERFFALNHGVNFDNWKSGDDVDYDQWKALAMADHLLSGSTEAFNEDAANSKYDDMSDAEYYAEIERLVEQYKGLDRESLLNPHGVAPQQYDSETDDLKYLLQTLNQELETRGKLDTYAQMALGMENYDELSKYVETDYDSLSYWDKIKYPGQGGTYDYINTGAATSSMPDDAGLFSLEPTDQKAFLENWEKLYTNEGYDFMTPDEVRIYNALYRSNDMESAKGYLQALSPRLTKRRADYLREITSYEAVESLGGAAKHFAGARGANIENALLAPAQFIDALWGNADPNSWLYDALNYKNTVGTAQGEWLKNNTNLTVGNYNVAETVYNAVSSGLDTLSAVGVGYATGGATGFSALAAPMTMYIQSSNAASNTLQADLQAGWSPEGAVLHGFAVAGVEALTEKFSIDQLMKEPDNLVKYILKNQFTEATEETASYLLDPLAEYLTAGITDNYTNWYRQAQAMAASGEYASTDDAMKALMKTWVEGIPENAISAAISSIIPSSATGSVQMINQRTAGRDVIRNDNLNDLLSIAREMGYSNPGSKSAISGAEIQQMLDKGKKPSFKAVGRLMESTVREIGEQHAQAIDAIEDEAIAGRLVELGDSQEAAKQVAPLVREMARGKKVSGLNPAARYWSDNADQVLKELVTPPKTEADLERTGQSWKQPMQERMAEKNLEAIDRMGRVQNAREKKVAAEVKAAAESASRLTGGKKPGGKNSTSAKVNFKVNARDMEGEIDRFELGKDQELSIVVKAGDQEQRISPEELKKAEGSGVATIIEYAANRGGQLPVEEANTMLKTYEAVGGDVEIFLNDFDAVYSAAYSGVKPGTKIRMAERAALLVEEAAKDQAAKDDEARLREVKATRKGKVTFLGKVNAREDVHGTGTEDALTARMETMTESQQTMVEAVKAYAELLNANVILYESTEEGMREGVQEGSYTPGTNDIYIDINAGSNAETMLDDTKKGTLGYGMMSALSHELTHFAESSSREGYAQLKQLVKGIMAKNGTAWNDAVREKQAQYAAEGQRLTRAGAEAEVVADGMSQMLRDSQLLTEQAQKNPSLFEKLGQKLKELVDAIRNALMNTRVSRNARRLMDETGHYVQEMVRLWDNALREAGSQVKLVEDAEDHSGYGNGMVEYSPRDGESYTHGTKNIDAADVSYDALTKKHDMTLTLLTNEAEEATDRKKITSIGLQNVKNIGVQGASGTYAVHVGDINGYVHVSRASLQHGLDRRSSRNALITQHIGELLKNAILINKATPKISTADSSYVLLSAGITPDGVMEAAKFIVNKFTHEVKDFDVLYSVDMKKSQPRFTAGTGAKALSPTDSTISIKELLDSVKHEFSDVLSDDVISHYGIERKETEITKALKYSLRQTETDEFKSATDNVSTSDPANPDIRYSLRETENIPWKQQVELVENQRIPRSATLTVSKGTNIMTHFGFDNMPLGMGIGDYRKMTRKQNGSRSAHGLSRSVLLSLPKELQNPVAVFENEARNSLYFVTNQKDGDGSPVVAIVQMNQTDNEGTPMHKVISAYGMKNVLQYMQDHLAEGSRYIIQNEKAFSAMAGAQYIMTEADFHELEKRYTKIVAPTENAVNPSPKNSIRQTDTFNPENPDIRYSLREYGIETISEEDKNNIQSRGNAIISSREDLLYHINNALSKKDAKTTLFIGNIDKETRDQLEAETGEKLFRDLDYAFGIAYDCIRHLRKHFSTAEQTADSLEMIFTMLKDHDSVTPQTRGDGGKNLILKKATTEIELEAPAWINKRTRSVTVKTAYITKNNKKRISVNRPSIVDNRDGLSPDPDSKTIVASPVESVNPSPKFSLPRQSGITLRDYMLSLQPTEKMTEAEKALLQQYQGHAKKLAELEEKITEQEEILKDNSISEMERYGAQNRLKIYRDQSARESKYLRYAEQNGGFARMMRDGYQVVTRYLNGGELNTLADITDRMETEMQELRKELTGIGQELERTRAGASTALARSLFDQKALNAAAKDIKEKYQVSGMTQKEIANRMAMAYSGLIADGEGNGSRQFLSQMRSLAEDILSRSRDKYESEALSLLRSEIGSINLGEMEISELKKAGISLSQFKKDVAPYLTVSDNGDDLSAIASNYPAYVTAMLGITEDMTPGDLVLHIHELILAEKAKQKENAIEGMTYEQSVDYVTTELMGYSLPGIDAGDSGVLDMLKKELTRNAEGSTVLQQKVEELLKKAANVERGAFGTFAQGAKAQETAREALAYYTAMEEHYRKQELLEQKERITEQLKGEAAEKLNTKLNEYRIREEKAREYRRTRDEVQRLKRLIRRNVKYLNTRRANETDTRHIPDALTKVVDYTLEAFTDGNLANLTFSAEKAMHLNRIYRMLKESDTDATYYWDDEIEAKLEELADNAKTYYELTHYEDGRRKAPSLESYEELQQALNSISDFVSHIKSMVDRSEKEFIVGRKLNYEQYAKETSAELLNRKDAKVTRGVAGNALKMANELIFTGNMTPVYFFERLGIRGILDAWNAIRDAQRKYTKVLNEARGFVEKTKEEYNYNRWMGDGTLTFQTAQDHEITLTREQALWVYATDKREKSMKLKQTEHLSMGGFHFRKTEDNLGKDLTNRAHILLDSDIRRISDWLTDEQKAYADKMVEYLSTVMGAYGNEASMAMYGYKKFREEYYFPFETWNVQRQQKGNEGAEGESNASRVKNAGFTKKIQNGAKIALQMDNFTDVVSNHIQAMATYSTMVSPIENMKRLMNYSATTQDGGSSTIRGLIGQKYGLTSQDYIANLLRDLNGEIQVDNRASTLVDKLTSTFKRGAVASSLSVVVQQPTAIFRAMAYIDPKYFIGSTVKTDGKLWDKMLRYSGAAAIKDMGKFDIGLGKTAAQWVAGEDRIKVAETYSRLKKQSKWNAGKAFYKAVLDKLTMLPGLADQITWQKMWTAVENEQHALHPEMDTDSDAFLQMVGKRFDDVMDHTQVYDSVLVKSDLMRSRKDVHKMATTFMSEPTVSLNMLFDALQKRHGVKGSSRRIATIFASQIAAAVMSALVQAWNDDDDKRSAAEKLTDRITGNIFDNINPLGWIPYINGFIDLLNGYEVTRSDTEVLSETIKYVTQVTTGKLKGRDAVWKLGGNIAKYMGIPLQNIIREIRRFENAVKTDWTRADKENLGYITLENVQVPVVSEVMKFWKGDLWSDANTAYYQRIVTAMKNGDTGKVKELQEYMLTSKMVSEDTLKSKLREEVKARYLGGKMTEEEAKKFLLDNGLAEDRKDAYNRVNRWKETDAAKDDEDFSYSVYSGVAEGIRKKSSSEINAAVKELLANGYTEKEVQKEVGSLLREAYIEKKLTQAEYKRLMLAHGSDSYDDYDDRDWYWKYEEMDFAKENGGSTDDFERYRNLHEAIRKKSSGDINAAVKELTADGFTEKEVQKEIGSALKEAYIENNLSQAEYKRLLLAHGYDSYDDWDEHDWYWRYDELDWAKKNGGSTDGYKKYGNFCTAVETGKNLQSVIDVYLTHGVKKSTLSNQITSAYREKYTELYKTNPTEAAKLQEHLLTAYQALGYDRQKKIKDIAKWLE